ncbi:tyrosine-type recombinase/integrase [Pontibacillus salicampi]|uniref:Tyrosine-type recombinase/integrase n=1 Tax=Pontibacillus salicampi TaxID=1449801 RepID=A0ABV6LLM5_9BACI
MTTLLSANALQQQSIPWDDDSLYQQIAAYGYRHIDWTEVPDLWLLYLYLHDEPTLGAKRKQSTLKEYFRDITHFFDFIHSQHASVTTIQQEEIAHYQMELQKQYKPMTIKRKTAVIKSFLTFLYRNNIIAKDLTIGLKQVAIKKEELVNRDLYEEEVDQLLTYFANQDYFMYTLLYTLVSTGLRIQELAKAKWAGMYYQPEVNMVFLTVVGKRNKIREVPIFEEVLEVLKEFRARRGFTSELEDDGTAFFPKPNGKSYHFKYLSNEFTNQIESLEHIFPFIKRRKDMEREMEQEGNPIKYKITPHTCRHYTASYYMERGADMKAIQDLLDHESSLTTDTYLRRTRKFKEHAAVKIGRKFR